MAPSKIKTITKNSKTVKSTSKGSIKSNKKILTTKDTEKRKKVQKTRLNKVQSTSRAKLTAEVYNTKGKVAGEIELPKEIFGAKINNQLISQAVRVYLANQRVGTASTKTRGEVAGSTRKIYKQKGTGRARHGSIRAPIFVKGGVVFGPKPRDYSLKLSKKMKRVSLFSALSSKFADKEIKVVQGFSDMEPKTKLMYNALKNLGLEKQKILLVLPGTNELDGEKRENTIKGVRNIENLSYIGASNLNTYEALNNNAIVFLKEAIQSVINTFQDKEK